MELDKQTYELTITGLPYPISKERQKDPEFRRNILLALYPECAESQAIIIAEKKFGQKFYPMPYNFPGWDIISEDKKIKVEVKQTSCLNTPKTLRVGSIWKKQGKCTHVMIFDFYNKDISISIIPHDEFFDLDKSVFHGNVKQWRWNPEYKESIYSNRYGNVVLHNTILFNKFKITK